MSKRTTQEVGALMEWHADGGCLPFAFGVHWMTGWPVQAVSERGAETHLHFAAIGPDGRAWDSLGPRAMTVAAEGYAAEPVWEPVDAYRMVATGDISEADITEACRAAEAIFGEALAPHIRRRPVAPSPPAGPASNAEARTP